MTKVLECTCEHEHQDKIYGKRLRLHNSTVKGKSAGMFTWRCTVCMKERASGHR